MKKFGGIFNIMEKPVVKTQNAHYLKGHASWLYCDNCNKTVAYLCYITYRYFRFDFTCSCGCCGFAENQFGEADLHTPPAGELQVNPANKRYCCMNDDLPLFSVVPKNLQSYNATVVCKECNTVYTLNDNQIIDLDDRLTH